MKTRNLISASIGAIAVMALAVMTASNYSSAAGTATTPTTLKITTGALMFYKDTGADMNTYFGAGPNTAEGIDIGTYTGSLDPISAASAADHRFTLNDQEGKAFTITLASSALTAGDLSIAASNVSYTGTTWNGTGKAMTATGVFNAWLDTSRTFVARTTKGLSKASQEITLLVAIPAAQAPEDYTGTLTFTITQP